MNGAELLVRAWLAGGVDTCLAKPATSEMHFAAALNHLPSMRCVLGLFKGIVTGTADGYGRCRQKRFIPGLLLFGLGTVCLWCRFSTSCSLTFGPASDMRSVEGAFSVALICILFATVLNPCRGSLLLCPYLRRGQRLHWINGFGYPCAPLSL